MKGLEQISWIYDLGMGLVEWMGLGRRRQWLTQGSRGRTLEIGCGTGRNLPRYRSQTTAIGLDPDLGLLITAHRRAPEIALVVGRAEELPFASDAFETTVSSLVFCSVARPEAALAEVARVLRPAGQLRMIEHVRSQSSVLGALQDLAQPAWTRVTGGCHPNRDTLATVRAAGFEIDESTVRSSRSLRCLAALPPQS